MRIPTIAILFPQTWEDSDIQNSVKSCEDAGFSVSFSIGDTDGPCVDAENPEQIQRIIRKENQCR